MSLQISLNDLIMQKVLRGRIAVDCNLFGGKIKQIVLTQSMMEEVQYSIAENAINAGRYCLYRIPAEERENVAISEVNGITYPGNLGGSHLNMAGYGGGATIPILAAGVLDSQTYASSPPRPLPELISGDLVRLNPPQYSHIDWVLSARLCYDENFTNMNSSALDSFADLVVCAVKAYIYNKLVISIDRGWVEGGSEIGTIKQIVDTYSEMNERYKELLTSFAGGATLDVKRLEVYFRNVL